MMSYTSPLLIVVISMISRSVMSSSYHLTSKHLVMTLTWRIVSVYRKTTKFEMSHFIITNTFLTASWSCSNIVLSYELSCIKSNEVFLLDLTMKDVDDLMPSRSTIYSILRFLISHTTSSQELLFYNLKIQSSLTFLFSPINLTCPHIVMALAKHYLYVRTPHLSSRISPWRRTTSRAVCRPDHVPVDGISSCRRSTVRRPAESWTIGCSTRAFSSCVAVSAEK